MRVSIFLAVSVPLVLSQESVSVTTSILLVAITPAPSTTIAESQALIGYSTEPDIGGCEDATWNCPLGQTWSQDGNYAGCCDSNPAAECDIGISCLNTSLIVGPNSQQTWPCSGTGTQTSCVTGFVYPSIGATQRVTNVECWPTWNGGNWTATRDIGTNSSASTTIMPALTNTSVPLITSTSNQASTSSLAASTHSTSKGGAKIGIGVGIALVVVLLALGLGWFIVVHRRKTRRQGNGGTLTDRVPTINEMVYTPQEIAGNGTYMMKELPASSSTVTQIHELQDSTTSPQRIELGAGAENKPLEPSSPASRSHIQLKPISPGHSSFPPPWDTSFQQGNDERQEQSGIWQSQQETRNTGADEMVIEPDDQDPELLRLEEEMARIKAETDRFQRLQDLGLREQELKKTIGERRKSAAGPSNS